MVASSVEIAASLRKAIDLQPGEKLYVIVDAARDDGKLAFEIRDRFQVKLKMLFQGEAAQYMTEVAPYLVEVDPDSEFLDLWAKHWGTSAGILLTTSSDPRRLFRHLRELFLAQDDQGNEWFFRFYDPRVLRVYFPTCRQEDYLAFFGPICSLIIDGNEPGELLRFSFQNQVLQQLRVTLHG